MSSEEGFSNFLQTLKRWKNSEGLIVFVNWSSGTGDVAVSCRAQVFDVGDEEVQFTTDEDKGNVSLTVSLVNSKLARIDEHSADVTWDSGAKLSMWAKPSKSVRLQ